jgi:RHS repeat-associated protein
VTHTYSNVVVAYDYYPYGLPMENRQLEREQTRHNYQGEYAEKDEETGYLAFQLRFYDARIGRWVSPDPYEQFASPYVGMGNLGHISSDPDGGLAVGNFWSNMSSFLFGGYWQTATSFGVANGLFPTVGSALSSAGGFALQNAGTISGAAAGVGRGIVNGRSSVGVEDCCPGLDMRMRSRQAEQLGRQTSRSSQEWYQDLQAVEAEAGGDAALNAAFILGGEAAFAYALRGGRWLYRLWRVRNAARIAKNIIPEGKLANHLFKGANKLADTPANRKLITEISNGRSLGVDSYGKSWYAKTLSDGRQIYTYTQNGIIKGAGINKTPVDIVKRYGLK